MSRPDAREIANWLTSRDASSSCPVCGLADFLVANQMIALPVLPADGGKPVDVIPVAGLICKGCGYVQLHATKVLEP